MSELLVRSHRSDIQSYMNNSNIIINSTIKNYLKCKYKAYLINNEKSGNISEYEILENKLLKSCQVMFFRKNKFDLVINLEDFHKQRRKNAIVKKPTDVSKIFNINIDALEIINNNVKNINYIPILISPNEKVKKNDKLLLAIYCLIFSEINKLNITFGKIVYGSSLKSTKFKVDTYLLEAQATLKNIIEVIEEEKPPRFFINNHCNVCEFKNNCKKILVEKDDLSLLRRITEKEILKINNKGIFTIFQLSFTFKPKKRHIIKNRCIWELRALALKENKTYIIEMPKLKKYETEVFIDFEGLPDENYIYLIGIIIKKSEEIKQYSFWADSQCEEEYIYLKLFNIISKLNNYMIYHYGAYELKSLRQFNKKHKDIYESEINNIINKSINILTFFSTSIYPPVYSNGLKEIANFLGFHWSSENASGIESIVWRKQWALTQEKEYKEHLIAYNIEDCQALSLCKNWLCSLALNQSKENNLKLHKINFETDRHLKFGRTDYVLDNFYLINKCAYFDYQRTKIFFRINKHIRKSIIKKDLSSNNFNKIDKIINNHPGECPNCNHTLFHILNNSGKTVINIKFMKYGIKKWIVRYQRNKFKCKKCDKIIKLNKFNKFYKYGHNLMSWSINQHFIHKVSIRKIDRIILETFKIKVSTAVTSSFRTKLARKYQHTVDEIKQNLINGNLIHADETTANVQGCSSGYVWVFTNMDSVLYLFKPNRESGFLKDMLTEFEGVLVSDFYQGYDSLPCLQQKCLIHLIRDLNEDLQRNQFDSEYKHIVVEFGKLLKIIIETIDRFGLKNKNLNKHINDVEEFYTNVVEKHYTSEIALKNKKRLLKNKEKLFTFLSYDGVPWNNNNAEHAIKPFADFRSNACNDFTEKTIEEHLAILSIAQTCHYRGINFLEFLKSKKIALSAI